LPLFGAHWYNINKIINNKATGIGINEFRICTLSQQKFLLLKYLNKFDVSYIKCRKCNALFTEAPYRLEEAYTRSINLFRYWAAFPKFIYFSQIISVLLFLNLYRNAKFLDYAGDMVCLQDKCVKLVLIFIGMIPIRKIC